MSYKPKDIKGIVTECQKLLEDGVSLGDIYYCLTSAMVSLYVVSSEEDPIDHAEMSVRLAYILYDTVKVHEDNA